MTPFMGLTLPTVGVTLGPEWATELNAALTVVDEHNHTVGQGVPVPTTGLNINADLPLNSFNLSLTRAVLLNNNPSPLSTVIDVTNLYASGGNLWYNNAIGQQIQITAGAGLNAASVGGFGGDYGTSTASAFYTSITSTFTFWQSPHVSALMDVGATTIHPSNSSVNGVTILAPTALSSSYNLTLPTSLPLVTSFLTVGSSGAIGDTFSPDGTTIQFSGSVLQANPPGFPIGTTPVGTFVASNFTFGPTLTQSTTSTSFVTLNGLNITNSGFRPVEIWVQPDGTGVNSIFSSTGPTTIFIQILRNGTSIFNTSMNVNGQGLPTTVIRCVDYAVSGTVNALNYVLQWKVSANTGTITAGMFTAKEIL